MQIYKDVYFVIMTIDKFFVMLPYKVRWGGREENRGVKTPLYRLSRLESAQVPKAMVQDMIASPTQSPWLRSPWGFHDWAIWKREQLWKMREQKGWYEKTALRWKQWFCQISPHASEPGIRFRIETDLLHLSGTHLACESRQFLDMEPACSSRATKNRPRSRYTPPTGNPWDLLCQL